MSKTLTKENSKISCQLSEIPNKNPEVLPLARKRQSSKIPDGSQKNSDSEIFIAKNASAPGSNASTLKKLSSPQDVDELNKDNTSTPELNKKPPDYDSGYWESNVKNVIKVQSCCRRLLIQNHYKLILKLHNKRTRVVNEIWHSETTYLDGLMCLLQYFHTPLMKLAFEDKPPMTKEEVNIMFGNLRKVIDVSKMMVSVLHRAVANWTPSSRIGPIFIEHLDTLSESFTAYTDAYDEVNSLFIKLKKNEVFREWLAKVEFKQCDLALESYLIMPIQRLTRYGLLLRELIHQTWQDHIDYEPLCQALECVGNMTHAVNDHKKKLIMIEKIKSLFSIIVGLPKIPPNNDRTYITEGAVTDLASELPVTHYLFLFNDIMIWTQQITKKKFLFRRMNWLKYTTAEPCEMTSLKIITNEFSTTVFTKTKEEQNKWMAYLENEEFSPNSSPIHRRPDIVFLDKDKRLSDKNSESGVGNENQAPKIPHVNSYTREYPKNSKLDIKGSSEEKSSEKKKHKKKSKKDHAVTLNLVYNASTERSFSGEFLKELKRINKLSSEQREAIANQMMTGKTSDAPDFLKEIKIKGISRLSKGIKKDKDKKKKSKGKDVYHTIQLPPSNDTKPKNQKNYPI